MGTYWLHLLSSSSNLIIIDTNKNIYCETTILYAELFPLSQHIPHREHLVTMAAVCNCLSTYLTGTALMVTVTHQ